MTQTTRPDGVAPFFAEDATFSSGAQTGELTKIEPSDAIKNRGWYPDKKRPAKWDNWMTNRQGLWAQHFAHVLDLVEVQNFPEPSTDIGWFSPTGTSSVRGMAYNKGQSSTLPRILVCGNGEEILASIDGGYTWANEYTPVAGADFIDLCDRNSNQTAGAIYVTAGVYRFARMSVTGTWVNVAATDATDLSAIAGDPYRDYFWVVGDFAGAGYLRRFEDDSAPAYTTFDVASFPLLHVAVGPDIVLAASATKVFRVDDPAGAAAAGTLVYTSTSPGTIVGLVYLAPQELFVLFTSDFAAGTAEIFTSPDGDTWTQVGVSSGAGFFGIIAGSCLARGSILLSSGTKNDLGKFLHVSRDAGATWGIIPDPLCRHNLAGPVPQTSRIRSVGNRIMCAGYVSGTNIAHALSQRVGPIV